MSRSQFQSEIEHISTGLYWIARQVQQQKTFMSELLEDKPFDDFSRDELNVCLNELGDYMEVMAKLADDTMRLRFMFEGVLEA